MSKLTHIQVAQFFNDYAELDPEDRMEIPGTSLDTMNQLFELYDWFTEKCGNGYISLAEMDSFVVYFGPHYRWASVWYDPKRSWFVNFNLEIEKANEILEFLAKFDSLCGD